MAKQHLNARPVTHLKLATTLKTHAKLRFGPKKIGNTVEAKFYSGCKQLAACNAEYNRNFFSVADNEMSVHDLCKSAEKLPARFYRVSECTFCKRMASSANADSQLFGTTTTDFYVNSGLTITFADLLDNPKTHMADFFADNNDE